MASEKSRRKQSNLKRKAQAPAGAPMRHRDGDRRRRAWQPIADQAVAEKFARRWFGAMVPPPSDEDDEDHDEDEDDPMAGLS